MTTRPLAAIPPSLSCTTAADYALFIMNRVSGDGEGVEQAWLIQLQERLKEQQVDLDEILRYIVDETTRQKAAIQLSKMTGISTLIWLETDLRLPSSRFRKELLRAEGKVLGRFDARVAWAARSKDSDYASYDPSYAVAYGAFSTAMLDYLSADLGWEEDNPYEILTGKVRPWKWGRENSIVNLTSRISNAMVENPKLKVLVMCGHTDLATPPTGIEHSFRQMLSLPAEQRSNVEFTYYDAGHMFYLNEPGLAKMRKDLVKFLAPTK